MTGGPPRGLYLHVPFCHARCGYCDFATATGQEDRIDEYIACLLKEAALRFPATVSDRAFTTIFIGGGTPSVLAPTQMKRLVEGLGEGTDLSGLEEFTVEANPESTTMEKISSWKELGVNRISFGLQAVQDDLLRRLDRLHTREDFYRAFRSARQAGYDNISLDLIFGLPGQTLAQWLETLDQVVAWAPEHVSAYALKVEAGTPFHQQGIRPESDLQADMYLAAAERLSGAGYDHYEISNFARPGRQSRHNLLYWRNQPTMGLGVSAASYWDGKRATNPRQIGAYMSELGSGRLAPPFPVELETEAREKEEVMLGLRLRQGVAAERLRKLNLPLVEKFLQHGLAIVEKGMYCLTPRGWLLSNQLFQHLV